MSSHLPTAFRILYGLMDPPSDDQIVKWTEITKEYIDAGVDADEAGRRAAAQVFGRLYAVALFSEADTIDTLLARAEAVSHPEDNMSNIGGALRVKYKLVTAPTDSQAAEWAVLTERLIREGMAPEEAGFEAARRLFVRDDNLILKAEADTIESLLEQAKNRK